MPGTWHYAWMIERISVDSAQSVARTWKPTRTGVPVLVEQHDEPDRMETTEPATVPDEPVNSSGDNSIPTWLNWIAFIGIFVVSLGAGIGRMLHIDRFPGGMAEAEAQHGLLARQSNDFGLQWAIENAGGLSTPLVVVISWVGSITGYDAETPRIAAAFFGMGSILFTGLWLNRGMGPIWGLAGSAILAGSFWHILFSRLGIGQIVGAFALATLCWLLSEAAVRAGSRATPWFIFAGFAAGLGFLATPSLRLLPLVILGALIISLVNLRRNPDTSESRNWLMATAATYLTISPFLIANRGDLWLRTPWAGIPGLPRAEVADLGTLPGAVIDSVTSLVVAGDADRGLNLPADPWFSLLMLPWALIGILGVISASNDPRLRERFQVGLAIGIAAIIGISATDAGHPGQIVVISPALAALTVVGFRTALRWARVRTVRFALASLIVIGIAGEAFVSTGNYTDEWAANQATRAAFHTDVTDTLESTSLLETREPVFVALSGHETALDYFYSTARRHTFDGQSSLPFPADEDGFLITAESLAEPLAVLLDYAGLSTQTLEQAEVPVYRLDDRLREQLPFSVPTIRYPNGPEFYGASILSQRSDDHAAVLMAWKMAPESSSFTIESRLRPVDPLQGQDATTSTTTLPANPLRSRLYQVLLVEIELPQVQGASDLEIRVRREDGTVVPVTDMGSDGYLHLERYQAPE